MFKKVSNASGNAFYTKLLLAYRPTFEKLAYAMYPFLADIKELIMLDLAGNKLNDIDLQYLAGAHLGHPNSPVELILESLKDRYALFPQYLKQINAVEGRIQEEFDKQLILYRRHIFWGDVAFPTNSLFNEMDSL